MTQKFNQEQTEHLAAAYLLDFFANDSRTQSEFKTADKSAGYDGIINFYNISLQYISGRSQTKRQS